MENILKMLLNVNNCCCSSFYTKIVAWNLVCKGQALKPWEKSSLSHSCLQRSHMGKILAWLLSGSNQLIVNRSLVVVAFRS